MRAIRIPVPDPVRNTVYVTAFQDLSGPGKLRVRSFIPHFFAALASEGIRVRVVPSSGRYARIVDSDAAVVNIFKEEHRDFSDLARREENRPLVFNRFSVASTIADKARTHALLTGLGIPMPKRVFSSGDGPIFSNAMRASGSAAFLTEDFEAIADGRYNTEFVDTRRRFRGRDFHTCVRLMCVGEEILHAYVRARDVAEGSPTVHNRNTPLDADLIEHLQSEIVERHRDALTDIARRVAGALGPGFYAHDIVVRTEDERVLLCETGFKFYDRRYGDRLRPLAAELPSHAIMFSDEMFSRSSALAFLRECGRLSAGWA